MKTNSLTKSTFGQYPEISTLAQEAFPFHGVSVQAAMLGDDYTVVVAGNNRFQGTAAAVRKQLEEKISYDMEVCK